MHPVHLVKSHRIDLLLKEIQTAEMTGNIEVQASVTESRTIIYNTALHFLHPIVFRYHLSQCLLRIKGTGIIRRSDPDPILTHFKSIGFRSHFLRMSEGDLRRFFKSIYPFTRDYLFRHRNNHIDTLCQSLRRHCKKHCSKYPQKSFHILIHLGIYKYSIIQTNL